MLRLLGLYDRAYDALFTGLKLYLCPREALREGPRRVCAPPRYVNVSVLSTIPAVGVVLEERDVPPWAALRCQRDEQYFERLGTL